MIHGLLHGIRRCLLRVTQGFAARRRPGARRKRGGFMGRAGIDLFIEDGAYTTLSSAVVILVVLTLLFSSTAAIWSMSRAGDTQVAADSGALAGANVVSSYHTAATVVDASILSLGLAGFATIGTGFSFRAPRLSAAISSTREPRSLKRVTSLPKARQRACKRLRPPCRTWLPRVPCRQYRRRIPTA